MDRWAPALTPLLDFPCCSPSQCPGRRRASILHVDSATSAFLVPCVWFFSLSLFFLPVPLSNHLPSALFLMCPIFKGYIPLTFSCSQVNFFFIVVDAKVEIKLAQPRICLPSRPRPTMAPSDQVDFGYFSEKTKVWAILPQRPLVSSCII